jgi:uncharacterized delta-60 repeat protein
MKGRKMRIIRTTAATLKNEALEPFPNVIGEQKNVKKFISLVMGLLVFGGNLWVRSACAAAGSLDPTFGNGGVSITSFASSSFVIPYSMKVQPDGKILALVQAGNLTTEVLRYTSTGVLDTSFGRGGIAALPTEFSEPSFGTMALQSNGQIVVAGDVTDPGTGAAAFGVERLNTGGTVDATFGNGGLAIASIGFPGTQGVVLLEPTGDILLGSQLESTGRGESFHTALARFTSAGELDPTFGNGGTVSVTAVSGCTALALLNTGEILVVNAQRIAQFTPGGALEPTVTGGTIDVSANNSSTEFQPNGDYLLATGINIGAARSHNVAAQILRFTPTGGPDSTFANPTFRFTGTGGSGVEDVPSGIAVQANGDIVVAGVHSTQTQTGSIIVNGLARLTPNGNFDSTFGTNGIVTNSIPAGTQGFEGVVIQPTDGNIVTIGTANNTVDLVISRYLAQ